MEVWERLNIIQLLGPLGDELNNALEDPRLEPFYQGILAVLKSPWGEKVWKLGAPYYTQAVTEIYKRFELPDFQTPISLPDKGLILRQLDQATGTYVLIPNHLQLSTVENKQVYFKLQLIRSSQTEFPPQPHGRLDLRVEPHYYMDDALKEVRSRQPEARITKPIFVWGYLHIQLQGTEILPEKIEPMFLCWNGLSRGRILTRLSQKTATFLKSALSQGGMLPLKAVAEALVIGLSPRVPAYVRMNPINLLRKLRDELMNSDGLLARQDVVKFFLRSSAEDMGLDKIERNGSYKKQDFAEAMADRVLIYFGNFVPSPTINSGPYVKLDTPEEFENSQSTLDEIRVEWSKFWMLDVPVPVGRMYWLPLDMSEAEQQLAGQTVVQETTVPALLDGKVRVQIAVNVTPPRQGVDSLGVRILDSPDVDQDVSLPDSGDPNFVDLQFPPKRGNTYEYQYMTHSRLSSQSQELQADPESHTVTNFDDDFLYLGPNDFPVAFIPVEATTDLLEGATVQGRLKWSAGQASFSLSSSQPAISLAMPKGENGTTLEFEVHSPTGVGVGVVKISLPAKGIQLTPYNFREFGPQNVEINCTPSQNQVVSYEFQREGDSSSQSLWFTSDNSQKTLTYSSYSLFQYRFRYRRKGESRWSDYINPFQSLKLNP